MLNFDKLDEIERDFEGLLTPIANNKTQYATHGFHFYPATFIPQFPAFFIPHFSNEGDLVVDPMCGAGTTVIEAAVKGRQFFGCDIDPIAALISRVATMPWAGFENETDFNKRICDLLKKISKEQDFAKKRNLNIPSEKEFPNVLLWFRADVFRELIFLRDTIFEEKEMEFRDFLLLCLSSIVRNVSNADPRDIFPQRDMKNPIRDRKNTFEEFEKAVWEKFEKVTIFSKMAPNKSLGRVKCGDARKIEVDDEIAQLVFTSPPYAYAIDYARVQQLSTLLFIMQNTEFKEYRRKYIGTDRISLNRQIVSYEGIEFAQREIENVLKTDKKCGFILHRYFKDMYEVTKECYRILKPDGYLIYVVGNSTVRKTTFQTSEVFKNICESMGFLIEKVLQRPYYVYRMSRKRNIQSNTVKSDFFIIARKG
jgi:DNA modification methylase